jgi:hypothetical protein
MSSGIKNVHLYTKNGVPMVSFESLVDVRMFPAEYSQYPAGTIYARKTIHGPQSMYPAIVMYHIMHPK